MNKWDLYILNPLFILIGLFLLLWWWKKEKENQKSILFYIELILFWIANSYLTKMLGVQFKISDHWTNPVMISMLIFGSYTFFTIILKPLATFLTGQIHRRRTWMWVSIFFTIFLLVLSLSLKNQQTNVTLLIFVSILLAFTLASQSLYFLFVNEQFYYRMFPMLTSFKVGAVLTLGTFIGTFFYDINWAIQGYQSPNIQANQFGIGIFMILITLVSFGLSLFLKEYIIFVRPYENNLLDQVIPYKKKTLILLIISALLLGTIYSLTQSSFIELNISSSLINKSVADVKIYSWIRTYKTLYVISPFLVGYVLYKKVFSKIGLQNSITILISMTMFLILCLTFIHNPYFLVFANLFLGFAYSQIFYILFGLAIMWNYRTKGIPITGYVAAGVLISPFLLELVFSILKIQSVNFYQYAKNIDELFQLDSDSILKVYQQTSSLISIVFATAFFATVVFLIWWIFISKQVLGEYIDVSEAIVKIKAIEKKNIIDKMKERIEL